MRAELPRALTLTDRLAKLCEHHAVVAHLKSATKEITPNTINSDHL